jgi:hypothetical protein
MKFLIVSQTKIGSLFLLSAQGKGDARTTINNCNLIHYEKFLAKPKSGWAKRKRVLRKGILPACQPCKAGLGWGAFPQFCVSRITKHKKFSFP